MLKKHLQITQKGGIYIDNIGWILNMPKPSLSTYHVEINVVWQCGETWLNLVIITTPALPFRLAVSRSSMLMQSSMSKVSSSCQKVSGSCQRLAVHGEG